MSETTAVPSVTAPADEAELIHLSDADLPAALRISRSLRTFVDRIGRFGSWFAIPLVLITTFDLAVRKTGWVQIWLVENVSPYFGSTLLQELEWHMHTVLFGLVLGFGYIWNTHVRVDLVRENLNFRKKAWIEFLGLNFFLIPFTLVLIYFAFMYAYDSWAINRNEACAWWECGEVSASLVGLGHRWIIKLLLAFCFLLVLVAGIAVWLEMFIALFGPRNWRFPLSTIEWPEAEGSTIEGKERLDLAKVEDPVLVKARELAAAAEKAD